MKFWSIPQWFQNTRCIIIRLLDTREQDLFQLITQSLSRTHPIPLVSCQIFFTGGSAYLSTLDFMLEKVSILGMDCRRNGETTTGFGVASKGLLRAENAWTTLEPRPDSACLESAWPSFASHNLRSYPSRLGVLLHGRGRVRSRLVGVGGWNTVVDCRACLCATNPGANVSFDVRGKRGWKRASMLISLPGLIFWLPDSFLFILVACGFRDGIATGTFVTFCSVTLEKVLLRWKKSAVWKTRISNSWHRRDAEI